MGRGGFVIIIPPDENGRRRGIVVEGVQPPEVVAKFRPELKTYIGQLELLWAASPIASYPHLFANRRVIHFIDNSGAVGALIKGYATHVDCGLIVNAYHAMVISLRCNVYFAHTFDRTATSQTPHLGRPQGKHSTY